MFKANFHLKSHNVPTIDYKHPVPPRNDTRTSYYVGHRLIYDNDVQSKDISYCTGDTNIILRKKPFQPEMKSEMKAAFTPKYSEPTARCTSLHIEAVKGIKGFDELKLKFPPRPTNHVTTYKQDYTKKNAAPAFFSLLDDLVLESQVKSAAYSIRPEKPSYVKHLDMMASSHTLDYIPFCSEQQRTLAARDGISFWTWNDFIKPNIVKEVHPIYVSSFATGKNVTPSRNKSKTHSVPKLAKCVPNSGLTTEFKYEYNHPDGALKWKVDIQQPIHIVEQIRFVYPKTEYTMIGSGDRVQRFV